MLNELRTMVSSDHNYFIMRNKTKMLVPPLIPYPAVYYGDLTANDAFGDLIIDQGQVQWINVEKIIGVAFVIKGIQNHQKIRYEFQLVNEIVEHIIKYTNLNLKEAEQASLGLESNE